MSSMYVGVKQVGVQTRMGLMVFYYAVWGFWFDRVESFTSKMALGFGFGQSSHRVGCGN